MLGPLLFLLYINDLPENIHSSARLFADDTAVYLTVSNESNSNTLQQDLDTLQTWEQLFDMVDCTQSHYGVHCSVEPYLWGSTLCTVCYGFNKVTLLRLKYNKEVQ